MTAITPIQVLSQRLPATPEQVWTQVQRSAFIADYLGATLPAIEWQAGHSLHGTGSDGAPLAIAVIAVLAPCSLSLRVSSGDRHLGLQLSIAACADGSRLTVTHETSHASGTVAEPGTAPARFSANALDASLDVDSLPRRLAASPGVAMSATALGSPAALAAAQAYLADTALLVAALRSALQPRQGYALPAGGRFSLAQHAWHLADVEQFGWARRFGRLLTAHNPLLPGVDGDRLAIDRRYQQRRWHPAAARFVRQRQHTLAALACCTPATLQRPVRFGGQDSTGAEMLAALLAHDHEHRLELGERLHDLALDRRTAPALRP